MGLMKEIKSLISRINTYIENEQDNIVRFLKEFISIESMLVFTQINNHGIF
jgi:hypothetical protein